MGNQAFNRLLVVIQKEEPRVEYCPLLPLVVAILLMYMPESDVYHTVMQMIKQSLADCWWFPCSKDGMPIMMMMVVMTSLWWIL